MIYQDDLERAKNNYRENKKLLDKLKRSKPRNLDDSFRELHEEVFEKIDCLECANCCKTTSPVFIPSDIERLAKIFRMKPVDFIETHLKFDDDNDYVLTNSPCPFLGEDNKCIVYKERPRACREYPHTNRKRMYQITLLTLKNTLVCPAVSRIVEKLNNS